MKCIRCGLCCYKKVEFRKEQGVMFLNPCEHLTWDETCLATCAIHDNKPELCKNYFCWDQPQSFGGIASEI